MSYIELIVFSIQTLNYFNTFQSRKKGIYLIWFQAITVLQFIFFFNLDSLGYLLT